MWLVFVILFGGAFYDLKERRIPNRWVASAVLCGLGLVVLTASEGDSFVMIFSFFLRIGAVILVFFPFFLLRMMGAGDIKMMAVILGCLGLKAGSLAVGYGFLVGAVLALVKMLLQRNLLKRLSTLFVYLRRLFLTKEIVPYYIAQRDGGSVVIPFTACLFLGYLWFLCMTFFI